MQELGRPVTHVHALQTEITADAVLDVNNRIADPELRQVADHRLDVRCALALPSAQPARARCIQLGFGDDRDPRRAQHETFVQRRDAQTDGCVGRHETVEIRVVGERQPILRQNLRNRFAAPGRVGNDQYAAALSVASFGYKGVRESMQPADRIFSAPLDREQRKRFKVLVRTFRQRNAPVILRTREKSFGVKEQIGGWHDRASHIAR